MYNTIPILVVAAALSPGVATSKSERPCKLDEQDGHLISALNHVEDRSRPSRRFLGRIIERLAAGSQNRAQAICRAIESPVRNEVDFYGVRVLTLLDREQQMIELEAVVGELAGAVANTSEKVSPHALCSELWTRATSAPEARLPELLAACEKRLDDAKGGLLRRLDGVLGYYDQAGSMRSALRDAERALRTDERDLAQFSDLTIGDIGAKCEQVRPGCAAVFSLTRLLKLTDERKIRFDYERAIVHGMIVAARRAEQVFDSTLDSASWFASPVDILSRPLFHATVASVQTFIVEQIESVLGDDRNGYITRGGLVQAACNAYEEFDLHATPSAAERTVRGVILAFHETDVKNDGKTESDPRPVCTPEQALVEDLPQARAKVRRNLRRAASRPLARALRRAYKAEGDPSGRAPTASSQGGVATYNRRDWHYRALATLPVDLRNELARHRDPGTGLLTARAQARVADISACIIDKSPYCARSGALGDYTHCIAGLCGTQYYEYFVDPQPSHPLSKRDDECCSACCDEERTTAVDILEGPLRADIQRIEAQILEQRLTVIKALNRGNTPILTVTGDLTAICRSHSPGAPAPVITRRDGTQLTADEVCDFSRPMSLLWFATTHLKSCHMRTHDNKQPRAGTKHEQEALRERNLAMARSIGAALRVDKIAHRTIFTGYSSVLNAYTCHPLNPERDERLDWSMDDVDRINGIFPSAKLELPDWLGTKQEPPGCPGAKINRILRYLRAISACEDVLGKEHCLPEQAVDIGESTRHEWSAPELCESLKVTPSQDLDVCPEQQISKCLEIKHRSSKGEIQEKAAIDRRVEVSFTSDVELSLIERRARLRGELGSLRPLSNACSRP